MLPVQLLELDLAHMSAPQLAQAWRSAVRDMLLHTPGMLRHSGKVKISSSTAAAAAAAGSGPSPSVDTTAAAGSGGSSAAALKAARRAAKAGAKAMKQEGANTAAAAAAATAGCLGSGKGSSKKRKAALLGPDNEPAGLQEAVDSFTEAAAALFQELRPGAPLSLPKVLALCRSLGEQHTQVLCSRHPCGPA
jgi:hypothetical protein